MIMRYTAYGLRSIFTKVVTYMLIMNVWEVSLKLMGGLREGGKLQGLRLII